jgi:threonine synthase
VIQVGGGALGSACVQGLRWAHARGALDRLPRFHFVQTVGVPPLACAWRAVARRLVGEGAGSLPDAALAARAEQQPPQARDEELAYAARHRAQFMRPVDEPVPSVATGILDDETYDWRELLAGMLETGGYPLLATEASLLRARELGQAEAGVRVDATGSAGLAGLLELGAAGALRAGEQVAVIFTGVER